MLQQTRVAAAVPYYRRFLRRFPNVRALAAASEAEVLAHWSGLGYYARARNLHRAASQIVQDGGFPRDYDRWRVLPGVGDYTAAAVASIAFGQPRAALDGNSIRVLSRVTGERADVSSSPAKQRLRTAAEDWLDRDHPGRFNQALMELGATICLPRAPRCSQCPLARDCEARKGGVQRDLPVRARPADRVRLNKTLLIVERAGKLLLRKTTAGFWQLPEAAELRGATLGRTLGSFRHSITRYDYLFTIVNARIATPPATFRWFRRIQLAGVLLSTPTSKALLFDR